jgi:ATP-dependent helicase HrpB
LALECILWGVREPGDLPWFESPSRAAWEAGLELLRSLGAADRENRPTPRGREMAALGLEPRLAALCLAGRDASGGGAVFLGCAMAALLSRRDFSGISGDGDFRRRLALLRRFAGGGLSPGEKAWAGGVEETAGDLLARLFPPGSPARRPGKTFSWTGEDEAGAGELLVSALPDRIALRQNVQGSEPGRFRFPSGREARIEGPLEKAEWLVAAEADAGERLGYIRLAAPLSRERALEALGDRLESDTALVWNGLVPRTVRSLRAGKILLGEERRKSRREEAAADLPRFLGAGGFSLLPWDDGESPRRLLDRIRFFTARTGGEEAAWSDGALIAGAGEWLGPFLWEGGREGEGPAVEGPSLLHALKGRFGWERLGELEERVPAFFALPNGKKRPLDYGGGEPFLSVRLQDAFGIRGEQTVLGLPVSFELLSPAGRPLQLTRDLAGFWAGSYAEVRREMRGRYPKHPWPENP